MRIQRAALSVAEVELHRDLFEGPNREDAGGGLRPPELDLLVEVYKAAKPARSIEWGLGAGVSAVALGKARQALGLPGKHVVLDPFQSGDAWPKGRGLRCLQDFDAMDAVEFHPVSSEEYLLQARSHGEAFDFVFIDGAHDVGHKLMDACLTSDVISTEAIVCFHDSFFVSTSLALTFLVKERGMVLVETGAENPLRRRLRGMRHARRLGVAFSLDYAPLIDFSLSVLKRSAETAASK